MAETRIATEFGTFSLHPYSNRSHRLRASHDAVMVRNRTVLTYNPRLTAGDMAKRNPQPIVLDSKLRIPLDCGLRREPGRSVWLAVVEGCLPERWQEVEAAVATVLYPVATPVGHVSVADLLPRSAERGIRSVMIEGRVQVIRSLMVAPLLDYLVVIIPPRFAGSEYNAGGQTELVDGPRVRGFNRSKIGDESVIWN